MVTSEALTLKIREVLLPLIATFAPRPVMVSGWVISIWPLVRVIVPVKPDWNTIVSLAVVALAVRTADRSEPPPLSLRLVTVYVPALAGRLKIANKISNINAVGGGG